MPLAKIDLHIPRSVQPYLEEMYLMHGSLRAPVHDIFYANGSCELVFNTGLRFHQDEPVKIAKFIGHIEQPLEVFASGSGMSLGMVLTPLATACLLGDRTTAIKDKSIALSELLPKKVIDKMYELLKREELAQVVEYGLELIESVVSTHESTVRSIQPLSAITEQLKHDNGRSRLYEFTQQTRVSERQLQRLSKTYLGMTLSMYSRIIRFDRYLNIITTKNNSNLTACALAAGYFDQAHSIREVRRFTGLSPKHLIKQKRRLAYLYA